MARAGDTSMFVCKSVGLCVPAHTWKWSVCFLFVVVVVFLLSHRVFSVAWQLSLCFGVSLMEMAQHSPHIPHLPFLPESSPFCFSLLLSAARTYLPSAYRTNTHLLMLCAAGALSADTHTRARKESGHGYLNSCYGWIHWLSSNLLLITRLTSVSLYLIFRIFLI